MGKEKELPELKQSYELSEYEQSVLNRFKEELEHRLKQTVTIDIYITNYLSFPSRFSDDITFELQAGSWKRIAKISKTELELNHGQAFYYFMRRIVDDTMSDLLIRGANSY